MSEWRMSRTSGPLRRTQFCREAGPFLLPLNPRPVLERISVTAPCAWAPRGPHGVRVTGKGMAQGPRGRARGWAASEAPCRLPWAWETLWGRGLGPRTAVRGAVWEARVEEAGWGELARVPPDGQPVSQASAARPGSS